VLTFFLFFGTFLLSTKCSIIFFVSVIRKKEKILIIFHCNDHANDPSIDKKKKKKPVQGKEIPGFDVWFQRAEEPAEKLFIAFQTRHLR